MSQFSLPKEFEIEVSLFGAGSGYGESILLHLGKHKWFVIDSCVNPNSKTSLALEYLKKLYPDDYSQHLAGVVATHWHDDHVKGLSQIVDECEQTPIFVSNALNSEQFFSLLQVNDRIASTHAGINEFNTITNIASERKVTLKTVISDRTLFTDELIKGVQVSLTAASPSDKSVQQALHFFSEFLRNEASPNIVVRKPEPNSTSIVLILKIGDVSVMLGADLENNSDVELGWEAVFNTNVVKKATSTVLKVPHHGSETSHNERIYNEFAHPKPILIMTPWNRGRKLPNKKGVEYLLSKTTEAYITSSPNTLRTKKRDNSVLKVMRDLNLSMREHVFEEGHIRVRRDFTKEDSQWITELFGKAVTLNSILSEF